MKRSSHRPVVSLKDYPERARAVWHGNMRWTRVKQRKSQLLTWWYALSTETRRELRRLRDGIDPDPLTTVERCEGNHHPTLIRRQWGTLLRRLSAGRLP